MVSIFGKAPICRAIRRFIFNFLANQNISRHTKAKLLRKWIALVLQEKIHGLPSKSKCPSDRKHSVAVIIAVSSISFYETAICREIFSKYFFVSILVNLQKFWQCIKILSEKFQKVHKNTPVAKPLFVKLQAFTGATTGCILSKKCSQKGVYKVHRKKTVSETLF